MEGKLGKGEGNGVEVKEPWSLKVSLDPGDIVRGASLESGVFGNGECCVSF